MYIKEVIIEGFKSYKGRTVVESIHSELNVIIGANGSGKSNIVYAIQFVLSDEFSYLKRNVRESLLHQGAGARVVAASVKIAFDNSDRKLPISADHVTLCRRVGRNYDQYYINRKLLSRRDMMQILETAGFCSCNTYHIVKQGKVNQLATASDSYRLNLLLEIAGTHVYQNEIQKSKEALQENEQYLEKAKSLMTELEKRLETLDWEKSEFEEYTKCDKMKRALEYRLYECQLKTHTTNLENAEESCVPVLENRDKCRSKLQKILEKSQNISKSLERVEKQLQSKLDCESKLRAEEQQMQNYISEVTVQIDTATNKRAINEKAEIQNVIKDLEEKITQNEVKLRDLKPQYEEYIKKEEEYAKMLSVVDQKRADLLGKLGRFHQFNTTEDRDHWLQNELECVRKVLEELEIKIHKQEEDIQNCAEEERSLEIKIEEVKEIQIKQEEDVDKLKNRSYSIQKDIIETEKLLREAFCKDADVRHKCNSLREQLTKAKHELYLLTDKNVIIGLEGLEKVLENLQEDPDIVDGYYGMVVDNFDCEDSILTAVGVTAGKRLFYHIVANDRVSTKLSRAFNNRNLPGEINFFLQNHLTVKEYGYPDSNDAVALKEKLVFEEQYNKVMHQVFGRTLICRDTDAAVHFADDCRMDCITIDGVQVLQSGLLNGGYRDKKRSLISTYGNYTSLKGQVKSAEEERQNVQDEIKNLEDKKLKYSTQKQKLQRKLMNASKSYEQTRQQKLLMAYDLGGLKNVRMKKEKLLNEWKESFETKQAYIEAREKELGEEMASELTESEQRSLDQLSDEKQRLTEEYKKVVDERVQLQYDSQVSMRDIFVKQREDLLQELEVIYQDDICESDEVLTLNLEVTRKDLSVTQSKLSDIENEIEELKVQCEEAKEQLNNQEQKKAAVQLRINKHDEEIKRLTAKKNTCKVKIDENNENMNRLGPVPLQEQATYKNMGTKEVTKLLTEVNKKLKRFDVIKMQPQVHYVDLKNVLENAKKRFSDLKKGHEDSLSLLDVLETKKNDAVLFTFQQSSENFSRMFKKLVPSGHAKLTMKTSDRKSVDLQRVTDVSQIKGIGISVSFDSETTEIQDMRAMSGGQKSLLALTLIFALQKCSPVSLYVFDEVDSMLDAVYRPALAQVISDLSKAAQVILTSHGHEMLHYADSIYQVTYRNQVSHVQIIDKENALKFASRPRR